MEVVITRDAEEFAARTELYLAQSPDRNIMATTLVGVRAGHYAHTEPLFAYAHQPTSPSLHGGSSTQVVAAALRTPPWPLLASGFEDPKLAEALLVKWLGHDPRPPGIRGDPHTARSLAHEYERLTGGEARLEFSEAMHSLRKVEGPPRPAPGRLRPIERHDRELLIGWEREFALEAGLGDGSHAARTIDRRLNEYLGFVWEDDGAPVCMVGFNPPVAGIVRIGPVYTPPNHRSHGYASSAVAETSRRLLAKGASGCMLLTDLANPTSNRIYASIGYTRFGAWHEYRLIASRARSDTPLRT
ncbi:MAG TPA: GNAT family N-acetyltransferase [Solirubrobacteraceae bacterium]|nr:GNAT family N-acetyltransferase [Solirubrobacteraceae bacterium]